jgi:hypothetical protein
MEDGVEDPSSSEENSSPEGSTGINVGAQGFMIVPGDAYV